MASTSQLADLFSDAETTMDRGERLELLKSSLQDAIARHDNGRDAFVRPGTVDPSSRVGIIKGAGAQARADRERTAARVDAIAKSLAPEQQTEVLAALAEMREMQDDLYKDITVASPGNLHPYDLEAPAKQLVPRFTPLLNDIPRQKGIGTAREYRRILGYTNTGMGGVSDLTPFFNSESDSGTPTFGALALRRGQKISYAMDVKTANYVEMSLSDMVTYKAQFANLGFENSRSLSMMALLWAHKLGEEKALLWGRGASGSGYEGAVAAPTVGTPVSAGSGSGSGFGTTVFVKVTSYTGQGESLPFAEQTSSTLTAGRPLNIPITVQPTGAVAYGVYASTTTGTETFQGFFVPVSGNLVIPTFVSGGRVVPAADGSFNANGYDGFLSVLSDPAQAGYAARFDVTYPGSSVYTSGGASNIGDKPWQDAFAALYASVYADPEEAWINVQQRRQLADFVRNAGSGAAAYRITIPEPDANGVRIGAIVTGLHNESSPTDRMVALRVHPYMPTGASFIRSVHLDIPNSGIGDTTEITSVQEYMAVDWPEIQFTYDASTYWFGTAVHYAPKWSASILGLS